VKIAGRLTSISYNPKSTSRVTLAVDVPKSIFELNVAQGIFIKEAKIYPV